ncbi:MAG: efflux RND transporter periplasmic adaptor subunit [Bacteroidales bacterium]|nr:efflux RND transporter periplasmic adaptor subunit [Bacteroidales bacterium]
MNYKIFLGVLLAFAIASCSPSGHENEKHDEHEGHDHSEKTEAHEEHEEVKFQYTAYSPNFELFAEADAFIVGEKANVLSHFSILPDFKAVEKGKITITLSVNGKEIKQTLDEPTRKGIYSFDIQPETQGKGKLTFEIVNDKGTFEVVVPEVTVFTNDEEAQEASEKVVVSKTNTTVFTKEQSWKIEFATTLPTSEPFGQVIKTTALVQSSQGSEVVVSAKTNGIVLFNSGEVLEGRNVSAGQSLFSVSAGNFADNNISVKYTEAKSNFEKAIADYERSKELAKDKIVSEKDLLVAKNLYETTKAHYDNLSKNFTASGQTIASPQSGYIKQVFVKNGAYVEAGQPIAVVSQNKSLILAAEVPLKYAPVLANIKTANIRSMNDSRTFSLEQLKGKIVSYGKAANSDNYLIPVCVEIQNNGIFVAGSFVEMYLKTFSNNQALVIPKTSLLEEQGSYFVWVQISPELFEKREVLVGGTDGINTEIKKGIIANERVVSRGAMLIKLAQATGTLDAHSGHVH